jgi:hypothetical protein
MGTEKGSPDRRARVERLLKVEFLRGGRGILATPDGADAIIGHLRSSVLHANRYNENSIPIK